MVGTAGSGPKDRIDAGDEASMKILCPTSGIELQTNLREDTINKCQNIMIMNIKQ